jgi:DNA polymerase III gamma/tau subunit
MPNYMNIAESTKDWKQKKEAIDWLCAFSRKEAVSMNGHKYSVKFLDLMCKLINDGNTKIALHACEQFIQLVEPLKVLCNLFSFQSKIIISMFGMAYLLLSHPQTMQLDNQLNYYSLNS